MKEKQQKHRVLFITAPLICLTLGLLLALSIVSAVYPRITS